jgi:hypothetical protein
MKEALSFWRRFPVVVFLSIVGSSIITFAQDRPLGPPPFGDKHVGGDTPIDEQRDEARRRGRSSLAPPSEDRVLKKGVLAPSKQDRAAFAMFLRMPNTGLIRLLPLESVSYQKGAASIPGGGAFYSFANIAHFLASGSDIELNLDKLRVGFGGLGYGFLLNLGDVPLEEVALTDSRARFIAGYRPAVTFLEARAEMLRFRAAVAVDGIRYQDTLPVEVNATYLLRSINYGRFVFASNPAAGALGHAPSTDVLVAFRVVRKDADNSIIIAWKLLKKYSAPKLE